MVASHDWYAPEICACEIFVGYAQFVPRRSCGNGKLPEAFAGVGVASQLSPPPLELLLLPPLEELLLLPPLLDELPPLLLDELPLPEEELPEELPDELLPPLELPPASLVSPPPAPGAVVAAQPNDKSPIQKEESV
jgi:hypothetical protein